MTIHHLYDSIDQMHSRHALNQFVGEPRPHFVRIKRRPSKKKEEEVRKLEEKQAKVKYFAF